MFGALGRRAGALGLLPGGAGGPVPLIGADWLHPAFTFTRASAAALLRGTDGVLVEVGSGVPRFDPDLGLLIEGQRGNLLADARTPGRTGWTTQGIASAVSATGPTGLPGDATLITENALSDLHMASSGNFSVTSGSSYSLSVLARAGSCEFIQVVGRAAGFNSEVWANFRLSGAGSVGATGSLTTRARIERYGDWYWCEVVGAATATISAPLLNIHMATALTDARGVLYTGSSRSVTLGPVWVENALVASSPILPPSGTPGLATRIADLLAAPLAGLGIPGSGRSTFLATFMLPATGLSAVSQFFLQLDDGTNDNRIILRHPTGGTQLILGRLTAGVSGDASPATISAAVPIRVAVAISGLGSASLSINGGVPISVTGAPTSGLAWLRVGDTNGGGRSLQGYVKRMSYLPRPTADADLPALSLRGMADLTAMREIIQWP